jgi:SAM-dependent methyltransferase
VTRLVTPPSEKIVVISRITLPSSINESTISVEIETRIAQAKARIEAFQDRWDRPQIEQFVAADYALVFQSMVWTLETQPTIGRRFLEWGCGFAIVSALAAHLGLDAIGFEAEQDLLEQGRQTLKEWDAPVELIHGNFLPRGAESLADDPTVPSLGHDVASGYDIAGLDLDDFALVYAYPWPGEDDFHEAVFARYAAPGALLMLFCGPNDERLWRKTS